MSDFQAEYYKKHYAKVQYSGILGFFTGGYHKKIEKGNLRKTFDSVLEIGGGSGEHIKYVKHNFSSYILLDIVEDSSKLKNLSTDPRSSKIKFVLADAGSMPFEDLTFDRIVSTCVLHHIPNLESALREIRRVANNGASIDLYVPCDPGMLHR